MAAKSKLTLGQFLLLVEERSAGLYTGFAAAATLAKARGLVRDHTFYSDPKPTVAYQLVLTEDGRKAVEATGCRRKVAFVTQEVYCEQHGRKAEWPCRLARVYVKRGKK